MLSDGAIVASLEESLTYESLYSTAGNLWSMLFYTGYLTKASSEQIRRADETAGDGQVYLAIPNREIREIFISEIASVFYEKILKLDRSDLFRAVWTGDTQSLNAFVTQQLRHSISYYDAKEIFYHAFLAGMLVNADYSLLSNFESGEGRPDIVLKDVVNSRTVIIEVKTSAGRADLEKDAARALRQIENRR